MVSFIIGVFIGSLFGIITMILATAAKQADKELENIQIGEKKDDDKTSV